MIDVICPFCDKDYEKTHDVERMFASFPSGFELTFVDDRTQGDDLGLNHRVVKSGGVGTFHARKKGFKATNNEYVWFIDVDDRIFPFVFKEGYDFYRYEWLKKVDNKACSTIPLKDEVITDKQKMCDVVFKQALWSNIIRRSVLTKAYQSLPVSKKCVIFEDVMLNSACLPFVKNIKTVPKVIYCYNAQKEWWFSEYPKETQYFLSCLKGQAKEYMQRAVKENIDFEKTERDARVGTRKQQAVTFTLNRTCNKNCEYCLQERTEDLSDEEIYNNFDKCLTRCERIITLTCQATELKVQLMGGEPALWSDWLIKKIQKRLEGYGSYYMFTNGTKNKLLHSDTKAIFIEHVINWKGKKFPQKDRTIYTVVLSRDDIPYLEELLTLNPDVAVSMRTGSDSMTWKDIQQVAEIEKRVGNYKSAVEFEKRVKSGVSFRDHCRGHISVWDVDCQNMVASPCCQRVPKTPIDKFWGTEFVDCKGCLWFC